MLDFELTAEQKALVEASRRFTREKIIPVAAEADKTHEFPMDVFKEAWENMQNDFASFMPGFLTKRIPKGKGKAWIVALVTLLELLVLGVVGKLVYDWFVK